MRKLFYVLLIIGICSILNAKTPPKSETCLKITGFGNESSLQKAGAQVGDILVKYNKQKITLLSELTQARDNVTKVSVEIVLLRGKKEIILQIPSGKLGAGFKEYLTDHTVLQDAKILEGYGHLDWNNSTSNTFLACVALLEQKLGVKTEYRDLVGLSGYGFRVQITKDFCPSSPDACTGKNIGEDILTTLGYSFSYLSIDKNFQNSNASVQQNPDLKKLVQSSINSGYPAIALDMIEIPEWGLITGYQKNCSQFWCRTFFDKTEGYEIAQKQPWDIYAIQNYKPADLKTAYKKSLTNALEMYLTQEYNGYQSGLNAYSFWIEQLANETYFRELAPEALANARHGNWWTYESLIEARNYCAEYLKANNSRFGVKSDQIEALMNIYFDEAKILNEHLKEIPSNFDPVPRPWTQQDRDLQIKVLKSVLELENKAVSLLRNM